MTKYQLYTISTSPRFSLLLLSLMLLVTFTITATIHDDLSIVRENVRKIMLWPSPDQLSAVLAQAMTNLSALNLNTCQWPDLNYTTRGPENWDPVLGICFEFLLWFQRSLFLWISE